MADDSGGPGGLAEEESARGELYLLLGRLLKMPPEADDLKRLGALEGDDSELGSALATLAAAARARSLAAIREEYHDLFIGVGKGELAPYASYYLTGFLYEKPLSALRADMSALGIARADEVCEPEDHIAALCEMMAGLIDGAFGKPADLATQQCFFDAHIGSWAPRFFEDLEAATSAVFYMPVGTIGKLFMGIEAQAFEMAA